MWSYKNHHPLALRKFANHRPIRPNKALLHSLMRTQMHAQALSHHIPLVGAVEERKVAFVLHQRTDLLPLLRARVDTRWIVLVCETWTTRGVQNIPGRCFPLTRSPTSVHIIGSPTICISETKSQIDKKGKNKKTNVLKHDS